MQWIVILETHITVYVRRSRISITLKKKQKLSAIMNYKECVEKTLSQRIFFVLSSFSIFENVSVVGPTILTKN